MCSLMGFILIHVVFFYVKIIIAIIIIFKVISEDSPTQIWSVFRAKTDLRHLNNLTLSLTLKKNNHVVENWSKIPPV